MKMRVTIEETKSKWETTNELKVPKAWNTSFEIMRNTNERADDAVSEKENRYCPKI